jgi:beta-galactosidase
MLSAGQARFARLILGIVGLFVLCCTPAKAREVGAPSANVGSPRQVLPLSSGWRFRFGGTETGITDLNFDDSEWQSVDLPHTWNRMGEYALTRSSDTNVQQGIGWYRLRMDGPALARDRTTALQFDGVGNIADVWINGVHLGTHKGAFSRFRFDVTGHLKAGMPNIIVVKADNSKPGPGSSTEHVIPLGGDFFVHGGIYRGVSLISTDRASIDLLDHGGPGIYVSTPKVTGQSADVSVVTRLRNSGTSSRKLTLSTRILDAAGQIVASDKTQARLAKGEAAEVRRNLVLANPRLWQGRDDPYLYKVTVELVDGKRASTK